MEVRFRDFNSFNCWIWMRCAQPVQDNEMNYINTLLDSWFMLGRMGAYNAENFQVHEQGYDLSWMNYDNEVSNESSSIVMNSMSQPEYNGKWIRYWVDFGDTDGIALDLLINAIRNLDDNIVEILELVIGGVNEDWEVEDSSENLLPFHN
uniref:DUF3531 domain-containing protein n=1 Tax=Paulinella chromatophora TaxID=39717 RepID=B1X5M6_PAUCH|nr:hypothetical protein PCC_0835 [Paulinella chromatophora]ACB43245.1 hypothetical protein PCC_0835 [Paulinella chromatophora]